MSTRLGTHKLVVNSVDRKYRVECKFVISVTSEGRFTTTLSREDSEKLTKFGVKLNRGPRHGSRAGYFSNDTKSGLIDSIEKAFEIALSREEISSKTVLRYAIRGTASFGYSHSGDIIPNLAWSADGPPDMARHWQQGTELLHANGKAPFGLQVFVKPYERKEYRYRDGNKVVEYSEYSPFGNKANPEERYYLSWLGAIPAISPPSNSKIREIPYTEQSAKFFVELLKSLIRLSVQVSEFDDPERMIELIESNAPLTLDSKS
jgi:hypothetical protein